jgi:hypothetical protein
MADEKQNGVEGHEAGAKAQPSGSKADTPATAGKGETKVTSGGAEQAEGELNPSSPGNTGTTPGTVPRLG